MHIENLPNFLLVGSAKSGTTSLFQYLNEHPEIFIPDKKECKFFSDMSIDILGPDKERFIMGITKTLADYRGLFSNTTTNHKAIGDISNDYLFYYEKSIANIIRFLGKDVNIIIILRNPIDRAYSHYYNMVRESIEEEETFEKAIEKNEYRKKNNWPWYWAYLDVGLYYVQVKEYLENFNNVRVYLFDDLKNNPNELVKDLFTFLGINNTFSPQIKIHNKSGEPQNKLLHKIITNSSLNKMLKIVLERTRLLKYGRNMKNNLVERNLEQLPMKKETRDKLKDYYREDIEKLSRLINRDLSHWAK